MDRAGRGEIGSWPRTDGIGMTAQTREVLEDLAARLRRLTEDEAEGETEAAAQA